MDPGAAGLDLGSLEAFKHVPPPTVFGISLYGQVVEGEDPWFSKPDCPVRANLCSRRGSCQGKSDASGAENESALRAAGGKEKEAARY
jgi:hypothetical protein